MNWSPEFISMMCPILPHSRNLLKISKQSLPWFHGAITDLDPFNSTSCAGAWAQYTDEHPADSLNLVIICRSVWDLGRAHVLSATCHSLVINCPSANDSVWTGGKQTDVWPLQDMGFGTPPPAPCPAKLRELGGGLTHMCNVWKPDSTCLSTLAHRPCAGRQKDFHFVLALFFCYFKIQIS